MNILVTGSTGFIGRQLLKAIPETGNCVYAVCRQGSQIESSRGVVWLPTDLTEKDFTSRWPKTIDSIVCLAQSSRWRDFPNGAIDTFDVNARSLLVTAEFARKVGARKVVYASTGSIYTALNNPVNEEDPIKIESLARLYDVTKVFGEALLWQYSSYFDSIVLRLFMPYGHGLGPQMLFSRLVESVRNGNPIKLQGPNGLIANPIYIDDVVEAILRSLELDKPTTLNIAGPKVYSLRQIGQEIGRVLGRPVRFEVDLSLRPLIAVGELTRLTEVFDWQPGTELSEGLEKWLSFTSA